MQHTLVRLIVAGTLVAGASAPTLQAGGIMEWLDITGNAPSPIPGHIVARIVHTRWDDRAIPLKYVVNTSVDPIPNPLGPAFLTVASATTALQAAMDAWNTIPTSYIELKVAGTTNSPGFGEFDFTNEITFRTAWNVLAISLSTQLMADSTFAHGDDIDEDGDADVSKAIRVATDVDGDGDTEFPAGFYKAGTILDNDVEFNTGRFRFTVDPLQADTNTRSSDMVGVATHEFGHSFGLSHTLDNQLSPVDGTPATMFPFADLGDPQHELSERTLESDDIAWASYHYPEGTAASGLAALQPGDIAFAKVYGLIKGRVQHGVWQVPVAGASVYAIGKDGRVVGSGYSGTGQYSMDPSDGTLWIIDPPFDPSFNIVHGKFAIPVPKGSYAVGVEAVDGSPAPYTHINLTSEIGTLLEQMNFAEEFYNGNREAAVERRPGEAKNVHVTPGKVTGGIDITTARNVNINYFGDRNFVGFPDASPGFYYAVHIPASKISEAADLAGGEIVFHSIAFDTVVADRSTVPVFGEAMLATGSIGPNGPVIDLASPLDRVTGFIGQDDDFAPFFFEEGGRLGRQVLRRIADGTITDLFLVLRIPEVTPFPGVSQLPPFIGLDGVPGGTNDVEIFNRSYWSDDGGATFILEPRFNFRFSLTLSEPVK
jgi:hypothetical protein